MKCLIKDNKVVQLSENEFPVHPSLTWMDAPVGCQEGWVLIDGAIQEPTRQPKTQAELINDYTNALNALFNSKAKEKNYDSEISIVSYASSNNQTWATEATQFIAWRDSCWQYAYGVLAEVEAGSTAPTLQEFINNMPQIIWSV